jgi:hypothetical protein
MDLPSDTPPDGDFVRYVEKLAAASEAAVFKKQAMTGAQARRGQTPPVARPPRREATQSPTAAQPAGPSLWTVGKWVLMAWVALQLLSVLFPRVGMFSVPLLLAFAAWAIYRFKKSSPGLLTGRLRELAEQAAKEFKQGK